MFRRASCLPSSSTYTVSLSAGQFMFMAAITVGSTMSTVSLYATTKMSIEGKSFSGIMHDITRGGRSMVLHSPLTQ